MNPKTAKPAGDKSTLMDDETESQLNAIRAEVAAIAETIRAFVKDQAHVVRVSAGAAADQATAKARKMREELTHGVQQAEKVLDHRVQEHCPDGQLIRINALAKAPANLAKDAIRRRFCNGWQRYQERSAEAGQCT
jgi:regulator of protease activity HflC (stomatin/prohibitin superfamily)